MSIHVRKTAEGVRYDVRLRDPEGRGYWRTFRTKKEAGTFQARELADRSRGAWVDPRKAETTFGEWAAAWLAGDPAKRPKTRATDEGVVRRHLLPALGTKPLGAVTPLDVQRLVAGWAARYKPNTVRRHYAVLRAILRAAVEADLLGRSPCRGVKLPVPEPVERPMLAPPDLERLAEAIGPRHRALVYVGCVLGLRFGECAGLRVGRLDFFRSTLTVAESLGEVRGALVAGAPKSAAGRRTMRVPAPLVAMLAEHLAARGLTAADADAHVFAAPEGGPLRYAGFRSRVWVPATRAAGLDGLGFHDLRRAAATAMVAMGVDLRTAQARLGHSDPRLTLAVYAQATSDGDRTAADRLGEHFMAPGGATARDDVLREGR